MRSRGSSFASHFHQAQPSSRATTARRALQKAAASCRYGIVADTSWPRPFARHAHSLRQGRRFCNCTSCVTSSTPVKSLSSGNRTPAFGRRFGHDVELPRAAHYLEFNLPRN